jgi:hypothetical protein
MDTANVNMDAIRQRQSATEGESSADIEYLDEDEQKELISKMAGQNDRTNRFFRDIFTAGSLLFGLVRWICLSTVFIHFLQFCEISTHLLIKYVCCTK